MLNDTEKAALLRWYRQEHVLDEARGLAERGSLAELEEHLHMRCLFALSRHSDLPDWMRTEEGKPLFPTNLNPAQDIEKWRDAVEVAWEVMEAELSLSHDEVHRRLAAEQSSDWERFLESVEERKRQRAKTED